MLAESIPYSASRAQGELSRVMLALKTVLARLDGIPTLIFDEIDVGIGGRIAHQVGEKLKRVAAAHQVFVITHLPQIASRADVHLLVQKSEAASVAATAVEPLNGEARVRVAALDTLAGWENVAEFAAFGREQFDAGFSWATSGAAARLVASAEGEGALPWLEERLALRSPFDQLAAEMQAAFARIPSSRSLETVRGFAFDESRDEYARAAAIPLTKPRPYVSSSPTQICSQFQAFIGPPYTFGSVGRRSVKRSNRKKTVFLVQSAALRCPREDLPVNHVEVVRRCSQRKSCGSTWLLMAPPHWRWASIRPMKP